MEHGYLIEPKWISDYSSNVVMENLTISEGMISRIIDALGRDISNICFNSCQFDRYILAGVK